MKKRILSFCLLFSLLFGNSIVNAKGETINNTNVKKNISIEKVLNYKNFYVENGVKTYFILFSDVIKELEKNSINYDEVFLPKQISYFDKLDKSNLNKKNKTIRYINSINNKYSRVYISHVLAETLVTDIAEFGTLGIYSVAKYIFADELKALLSSNDKSIYIHEFGASEGYGYKGFFVKEEQYSGWAKGSIIKDIVKDYGVNPYDLIVREPWYYVESDFAYVPEGSSGWKKINGKWYEFAEYGDLIEHSGWREYNGKWMYHIPGDYGAYADEWKEIDSEWFRFDDDGYCVEGRGCD